MKQSDFTFWTNVRFGDMMEMAAKLVQSMFDDPDKKLNMVLGQEYLYLQAATRLFTDYGLKDGQDNIEEFMNMVFSVGVDRYKEWLKQNAGTEKYRAFERMVERGIQQYMDMKPLETLVEEAGKALFHFNQMIEKSGELTTGEAIELLKQYVAEQGDEPPQK